MEKDNGSPERARELEARLLALRTSLNTGAGLKDPERVYGFQVTLDELEALAFRNDSPPVAGGSVGELDVQALASVIHDARFDKGRDSSHWMPFEDEDHAGKVYCLRIANAVELHLAALAKPTQPAPTTEGKADNA